MHLGEHLDAGKVVGHLTRSKGKTPEPNLQKPKTPSVKLQRTLHDAEATKSLSLWTCKRGAYGVFSPSR